MYTLIAPKYAQTLRIKMCDACVHLDKTTNQCRLCKCFVGYKVKFAKTRCPIQRWEEYVD